MNSPALFLMDTSVEGLKMAGTVALAVLVVMAVLIWMTLGSIKRAERLQTDRKLRRRNYLILAGLYLISAISAVARVASGDIPPIALIGLPVSILLVWAYLRMASREKLPPTL